MRHFISRNWLLQPYFYIRRLRFDEEAVALVKSWQGEDALCFEDNEKVIITDGETLYDTSESLSVEENGGKPTIEVFADNGEDIINNTAR